MERRLRYLIGLPAFDGTILRPADRASHAPLTFDPNEALGLAMQRRPELHRQNLVVHQKQMELVASRSFTRSRIDLVSELRVLGFGDHLGGAGRAEDENAINELLQSELQEWALGVEVQRPVGLRLGRTAERNALVAVNKEAEILRQQQIQIAHEINAAIAEVERAQKILDLTNHRREIALSHLSATSRKFDEGLPIAIEQVLEAQRAITDADTALSIAAVDRAICHQQSAGGSRHISRGLGIDVVGFAQRCCVRPVWWATSLARTDATVGPQIELNAPQSIQPLPEILLLPPEQAATQPAR